MSYSTPNINSFESQRAFRESTHEIVSTVAYLIGVPMEKFSSDHHAEADTIFSNLGNDPNAVIIRNLCILRTSIIRKFKQISEQMKYGFKTIYSVSEYIPMECLSALSKNGIQLGQKSTLKLSDYVIEINRFISDRINNCRSLFPMWINWEYVRDLFIMENGLDEEGEKKAASIYYEFFSFYPYQMYINWTPSEQGNILYNDLKFVSLLYKMYGAEFDALNRVSDAGNYVKGNIREFLDKSRKAVMVVDCENSDPYKLCATLKALDPDTTDKISLIILFDDEHTAPTWSFLEQFTTVPIEHITIDRIKQNKSLVDIKLTARTCQEHYKNQVDSFIIVSSDSDYWALISSLEAANFLAMIEREKCGPDMKAALRSSGIFYCYIDDFNSGEADEIKKFILLKSMNQYLKENIQINVNKMMERALWVTRIEMSDTEKAQFLSKYSALMKMEIDESGDVAIRIRLK